MAEEKQYTNVPKTSEVKKTQLDNSELFLIVNAEDKYRISLANHWVTKQEFNTPEEAQAYIDSKPWDLIMNIAGVIAQFAIQEIVNNNNENK